MKGKLFFALENHEKPVSSNQQLQKLEKFAVGGVWVPPQMQGVLRYAM